ncbi:hypothetical protein D9757_014163 [Collybiopsis confluens]|uniref:AMP-dependent synthetase/ligase domain-containing protein n=1 Tax=Collybiopsis confluens TaxID=2823264 RepID=A0A8H5CM30_9AGAR|nr:hypothetical protein D9757_014163 [Collybiopsis confluens]
MNLRNHVSSVEESAARHPSRVAFKIPWVNTETNEIDGWRDITYSQYLLDIERFAAYWYYVLNDVAKIPQRSVIAIWGYRYVDVLHVYGIFRAGYITQLIGLFPDAPYDLIRGVFESAKPRAFIFESLYKTSEAVRNAPMPCYEALPSADIAYSNEYPLPQFPLVKAEDIAIIAQTSGTSSGTSKIVPGSYRWLDAMCRKSSLLNTPSGPDKQDIFMWRGPIGFVGQFATFTSTAYHAACVVQPRNGLPLTNELVSMIKQCNINKIHQFSPFIEKHFRAARNDPDILSTFCALDEIFYDGLSLRASEEKWAYQNGINLVNIFGSTECGGGLLISEGTRKDPRNLLRPYTGAILKFVPNDFHELAGDSDLVELIVPPEAPDCPDKSQRAEDGGFHLGDLFREIEPGAGIEENVGELCSDIITGCVALGEGRPSPVLIVESHSENFEALPMEIYGRIALFHAARHPFERIVSEKMIIAVPTGTLPRTVSKGTVQRRKAEAMFQKDIDSVFGL